MLLDADGFLIGADVHFSLSFAPDGTEIAGQSSNLAATFDAIAPTADWQEAILRAFQTWAVETNSDIGVVADRGDQFGAPGPNQKDDRFGDIRIGAIEMSPEVGAVSVPVDGLVSGTWFADVVFNTAYPYQTIDDIFAVTLHEAGNVFGLEDNTDLNSPLFTGGTPTGLPPTATDLAALQQLHGVRMADLNETEDGQADNDSFTSATPLKIIEVEGFSEGSAPTIVYGDITENTDQDFFKLKLPEDYAGMITIQVRSSGISLLAPAVAIYDDAQQLLQQSVSTSKSGDLVTLQFLAPAQDPFVKIAGADPSLFGIGGYSLVASFDAINQIDQATIDSIAGGNFRFLEQEDLGKFFDNEDDDHFGDDAHSDDTPLEAGSLQTAIGFVESTRYEVIGSIADAADVDFYQVKSPKPEVGPKEVMTILVRSLDPGGLVPKASVFDKNDLLLSSTILANGGGDYIIQVEGVTADDNYQVKIEAAEASGPFKTGNYNLTIVYGSQATQLSPMSSGTVGNGTTQNIHTLYLGQPQLFHLALDVAFVDTTSPTAIVATIYDDAQTVVYQIAARPGDRRSREAVLLNPGTYTVEVIPLTLDGSSAPALSYELLGIAISDLFVGDPDDPNTHPFACTEPGLEGFFCYPGDFVSPDPFLWDGFIDSINTPPDTPDLPTLVTQIFGDWWTWVWNQAGINGPPFGMADTTQVRVASTSLAAVQLLGPTGSVLDNDIDPEGGPLIALLQSGPTHGSLNLATDGTFTYAPDLGFQGRDEFSYTAFDFTQESAAATVAIIVGESGDFDADGDVDGADFLRWQRGFGTATGASLTLGDSDFDGDVDAQDLGTWQENYGTDASVAVVAGVVGENTRTVSIATLATPNQNESAPTPPQRSPAKFFVELPSVVLSNANSDSAPMRSPPTPAVLLPKTVTAQPYVPQSRTRWTTEHGSPLGRQIEARDSAFSDLGLPRPRNFRSDLTDVFAKPSVATKIG